MDEKILVYRLDIEKQRKIEEEKLREEAEKIAKKEKVSVREIMESSPIPEIPKTIGTATIKKIKTFEIVDLKKVPIAYLEPNESEIRKAIRDGITVIPGLRIFEKEIVATY